MGGIQYDRYQRPMLAGAVIAVTGIVVGSFGYYLAAPPYSNYPAVEVNAIDSSPIRAVSDTDTLVEMTPAQIEQFEANSSPIDPEGVTFESNEDLAAADVLERKEEMSEKYEVGEPLSLEDLEFLRAYILSDSGLGAATITTATYTVLDGVESLAQSVSNVEVVPAAISTLPFNKSKTVHGTATNAAGSSTIRISQPGPFDNGWSVNWTAKRTSGTSLTKIQNKVVVRAYGAVAAFPFVGLIYDVTRSSTSPANAQFWAMSRSETFGGAVTQLDIALYSYFWNPKGNWQIP